MRVSGAAMTGSVVSRALFVIPAPVGDGNPRTATEQGCPAPGRSRVQSRPQAASMASWAAVNPSRE